MSALGNLIPEITQERCTRYRFRYSACSRCGDQCPHQAINVSDEGVSIDAGNCTGCAICVASCPTAVFQSSYLPLAAIVRDDAQSKVIACTPSEQDGDIRVPCLGTIDVSIFASLALKGIEVRLRGSGHCEQCSHAPHGGQRLQAMMDALLNCETFHDDKYILPVLEDLTGDAGLDRRRAGRRQLFRRWLARGVEHANSNSHASVEMPVTAIRYAAHYVPSRRRLAETVLRKMDKPLVDESAGLSWMTAYVTGGKNECTGCEACARVCPTGALKTSEKDDNWMLWSTPSQCVGCGVCVEACTVDAITLQHGWQVSEEPFVEIHILRQHRCQQCGRHFIGLLNDTCPVCADDGDSFSAIFG